MMIRQAVLLTLLVACGSKKAASVDEERPAPFEVKVNKVEQLASVAANKTYAEQGLGKQAPDGKVFVCVQYTVTNKGDKPETLPAPLVTGGNDMQVRVSMTAAGNYAPEDWKADTGVGKIEPGQSVKRADCFEVAKDATTNMALGFIDTGWGPKHKPWKLSAKL